MWTREQLKTNAKINFKRNYWPCVAVAFIMSIVEGIGAASSTANNFRDSVESNYNMGVTGLDNVFSGSLATGMFSMVMLMVILVMMVVGLFVEIFVGNVLRVGANRFFIENKNQMPGVSTIFDGFKSGHYGNIVVTMFLMNLYIFLWSLLLIIPGIIKGYEYRMIPYILAENPGMDRREAFAISKRMMDGEKWAAFILDLSFIGWYILSVFTCGLLAIFYVTPYEEATIAELYAYNKGKAYYEGYIRQEDNVNQSFL